MLIVAATLFDMALGWAILRMVRQARAYHAIAAPQDGRVPQNGVGRAGVREESWPSVAVVVPARDEADVIGPCIAGLLGQDYATDRLCVLLVDDGSSDGTARIAAAVADGDPRFRLVSGTPLPRGWTGKSHACAQGAEAAGEADWLCFIDADTRAEPALLRAAVAHASRSGTGLLSLEPFQDLGSALERLVMPCGLYLVAATQDHAAVNAPDRPEAAANGQFILASRDCYRRIGGHAAVRSEICEDLALARLTKRVGLRFELLGAEHLIRTRMYRDPRHLWHGLSKNVTALGGGPARTVLIAGIGLLLSVSCFTLVGAAALKLARGDRGGRDIAAAILAGCGFLAALGLHVAGTRHFRIPTVYGFLFPIGYGLAFAIALNAARLQRLGRVRWKDRIIEAQSGAAP